MISLACLAADGRALSMLPATGEGPEERGVRVWAVLAAGSGSGRGISTALLTDRYELTMLDAALRSGVAGHRAVFEVFARGLPPGRRYGVVAGIGRLAEVIAGFRFGPGELAWLEGSGGLSPAVLEHLAHYAFRGDVHAYAEGECYFPGSPVLTVEASFGDAVLLETVVLSVLNFDSAVAAAAARMVAAAGGRSIIEMGSRRVQEEAAVAAARASYLAGFVATSNLEAGRRYGIPTAGTAAHAFVLAHGSERAAFEAQIEVLGPDTTLLVDTYDVEAGIEAAVAAARARGAEGPGAIRLDSGALGPAARAARAQLDRLGATSTRIVASSDLDEFALAALQAAPIDVYGVGTRVVTGSGAPTAGFVYKLVAIGGEPGDAALRPVAKQSVEKVSIGGKKAAYRIEDGRRRAVREVVRPWEAPAPEAGPGESVRRLQVELVRAGVPVTASLDAARAHHEQARASLGEAATALSPGAPALAVDLEAMRSEHRA